MISWLIHTLLPLTLLLCLMLLLRQSVRKYTDDKTVYNLWLIIPLSLLLYYLPLPWQYLNVLTVNPEHNELIQRYLVTPSQHINQELSLNTPLGLWLTSAWCIGATSLIAYWSMTQYSYRKALKLQLLPTHKYQRQLIECNAESLMIAQSSHIHSPILIGLFKQILVIPEDFEALYSAEQQQLIISHEACHFSQYHMWTNQLALLLLALFWFNPLAWRAYAVFRQDQEHACDQVVLAKKHTQSRIQYCKALVLAAEISPPKAFTLLNFNQSFNQKSKQKPKKNGEQHFMFTRIKQIKTMSTARSANQTITKVAKLSMLTVISSILLASVSYAGHQLHQDGSSKASIKQGKVDVSPTHRIEPKYPIQAAKENTEGSVVLKFNVEGDGSVSNIEVVNSIPENVFNKSAIAALEQWRYKATGNVSKNLLVQLDYLMSESSKTPESLIEQIKVSH